MLMRIYSRVANPHFIPRTPYIGDLDELSTVKVELSLTLDPEGSVKKSAQNGAEPTEWKNGRGVV